MRKDIPVSTCTVQRPGGDFCDAPSHEDVPFPICGKHASQLWRHVNVTMSQLSAKDVFKPPIGDAEAKRRRGMKRKKDHVVYYIQVGDVIKIGTSGNLRQRILSYPMNRRLLATEPGSYELESKRHAQFRALSQFGKEWFAPGEDLMRHINDLRAKDKMKPVSL